MQRCVVTPSVYSADMQCSDGNASSVSSKQHSRALTVPLVYRRAESTGCEMLWVGYKHNRNTREYRVEPYLGMTDKKKNF